MALGVTDNHHTYVNVSNMEKSLEFYRDFLGLKQLSDKVVSGDGYDALFGAQGVSIRVVSLETDAGGTIADNRDPQRRIVKLCFWHRPQGKAVPQTACDVGLHWVGIPIRDLEGLYNRQPRPVYHRFLSTPIHISPVHAVCFVWDPDGVLIELTNNNHLSLNVSSHDRALSFYRDVLGLQEASAGPATAPPSAAMATSEERRKTVRMWFGLPLPLVEWKNVFAENQLEYRNGRIELGVWQIPEPLPFPADRKPWDVAVTWAGFRVKNLDAAYKELSGKGYRCLSAPVTVGEPSKRAFLCQDPDGNIQEFIQG
ncbi:MAG: VOC family protein [Chloroflexi bacterium]|nr:VOC family protein [Chloroflexota bacterium]